MRCLAWHLILRIRIRLFCLFLKLIARAGTGARADGATDNGARRTGHGPTENGPANGTRRTAGTGAGLLIAFGRLAGYGTAGRAHRAADSGADWATNDSADDRAADGASSAADGLAGMLLVIGGRAICVAAVRIELGVDEVVIPPGVVHESAPSARWFSEAAISQATCQRPASGWPPCRAKIGP